MAKHRDQHRRGGRTTPKGTRPRARDDLSPRRNGEPDLVADIRRMLQDHPLQLLEYASMLCNFVDERNRNPFAPDEPVPPSAAAVMQTFIDVDLPETTALLLVVVELLDDEVVCARIRRELARRSDHLPRWLRELAGATPSRALEVVDVLGDGDNVVVGVRLSSGEDFTVVCYIDHNLGRIAKDGYTIPERVDRVLELMGEHADDDLSFNEIPRADAKVRIVEAIDRGARTVPPYETDSWPACRPLIEWVVRLLPEGGRGYEWREWSDDELEELADRFLASEFGAGFAADSDKRDLLLSLLWLTSGYGPGDPFHWSPVVVELMLLDRIPRKLAVPFTYLKHAPELIRALIRFAHDATGVPSPATAETLVAVTAYEDHYQRIIRSPRPQGPLAVLAAAGVLDPEDADWVLPGGEAAYAALQQEEIEKAVGGSDNLANLSVEPLPDEPFEWTGIADDVRDRVAEVVALSDRCADELFDVEFRTACRRLLARVAREAPEVFRRRGRDETAAAAICWVIGSENHVFQMWGGVLVKDMLAHFGIKKGSVSGRAQTMLRAAGLLQRYDYSTSLGMPEYLVSARRKRIVELRDKIRDQLTSG